MYANRSYDPANDMTRSEQSLSVNCMCVCVNRTETNSKTNKIKNKQIKYYTQKRHNKTNPFIFASIVRQDIGLDDTNCHWLSLLNVLRNFYYNRPYSMWQLCSVCVSLDVITFDYC